MGKRLDFELTRPQSKAYRLAQTPVTDINLEWGRGNGKSWFDRFLAWSWVARADRKRRLDLLKELGVDRKLTPKQLRKITRVQGVRIVFLMPTLKQFKDVHGTAIRSEVEDWASLGPKPNWTDWKISFPGGSWIQPFPAAEHSSQRARGIRCDIVIADEADDIDSSTFDAVVKPWFSEPWSLKIRVTSGTYKRGRHGLLYHRRVLGRDPEAPRYHTIHATYRDSPEIVDLAEVEDARRTTNPATFAREWECDPDSHEGIVYPFSDDVHIASPPDLSTFSRFVVGVDHGWVDPGVFVLIGIQGHGQEAVAWILDEFYQSECPNETWNERARLWSFADTFFCDPSRPDRIQELRQKGGANTVAADNNLFGGISRVADMIFVRPAGDEHPEWARLYVSPKCVNTIKEFNTYRRKKDPKDSEGFLEMPEDRNNHAMDAVRYALVGVFGRGETSRHLVAGR